MVSPANRFRSIALVVMICIAPQFTRCLLAGSSGGDTDDQTELFTAMGYLVLTAPPPAAPLSADPGLLTLGPLTGPVTVFWHAPTGGETGKYSYRVYMSTTGPLADAQTAQSDGVPVDDWQSNIGITLDELEADQHYYINVLVKDGEEVESYSAIDFQTANPYSVGNGIVLYNDSGTLTAYSVCSEGQTFDPNTVDCTGTANSYQYCDISSNDCNGGTSSGTLVDSGAWTSGATSPAWTACDALNTSNFANINTWRLPTLAELRNIRYCSANPSYTGPAACPAGSGHPTIQLPVFPATPESQYWTAEGVSGNSFSAWTLDLTDGSAQAQDKTAVHRVRCVSDFTGF